MTLITTPKTQTESTLIMVEDTIRSIRTIAASPHLTFSEKVQALLVVGCQHFSVDYGALSHIIGKRYQIQESYSPGVSLIPGSISDLSKTYCKDTLRTGGPVIITQAGSSEWATHPCYLINHLETYFGTPVVVSGFVYGTLTFSSQTPHPSPFTTMDKELLCLMAQWIGSEIEHELNTQQLQKYADEIVKKNNDLSSTRDQAIKATKTKSDFLATMSHEIRTPLNAIIGITELLQETDLNSSQREYVSITQESAQVMMALLNDILDFSKIEAGKLELEKIEFCLQDVVDNTADMFTSQVHEKGLALMTFVDPVIPDTLIGDPIRVRQVLINLIGNAVKFTESGDILVRVGLVLQNSQIVHIKVEVKDSGIGISESASQHLFQPFIQADNSTARRFGGTGLGLAISKRLVQYMGGEIGVSSVEGQGSIFYFTAQFERDRTGSIKDHPGDCDSLAGTRVLVVDDNPVHRDILQKYLNAWGMYVRTIDRAESALIDLQASIKNNQLYQLAIIDLCLPGMDGFSLARHLAQDDQLKSVKVIMLTAYDEPGQADQAVENFCAAYLLKPFKKKNLLNAIIHTLDRANLGHAIHPDKRHPVLCPISAQDSLILLAEDNPTNQRLAGIQLGKLGYRVVAVSNGREVLEAVLQTNRKYDLILMDCQMPEVDGFTTSRIIRKAELTTGRHIPIIAMTANALPGDRESCLSAGMDDYLAKPIRLKGLREMIEKWTNQRSEVNAVEDLSSEDIVLPAPLSTEILQSLRELQGQGEPDFLTGLIDIFIKDSAEQLQKIEECIKKSDTDCLRRASHALKGSCYNLGAQILGNQCAELEQLALSGNISRAQSMLDGMKKEQQRVRIAMDAERRP